jgi:hypothetical protein
MRFVQQTALERGVNCALFPAVWCVRRYHNSAVMLVCRDKEMHFKGVQKQNILQSFKEGCSIHCLQESKQVTIVNRVFAGAQYN